MPVASRARQKRSMKYTKGFERKAMGKALATSCQTTEAAMVVMRAAMRPVLRKFWKPSETPRTLLPVPISTLRVQTAGDEDHGRHDADLAANHEAGQVASAVAEEDLAGHLGALGVSLLVLGHLGHGEEGNLHALEEANEGHEDEEHHDGDAWRDAVPDGGLALEQGREGDGEGVREDREGDEAPGPEEEALEGSAGGLVRDDGLAGELGDSELDQVRGVEEARELNGHANVHGDEHEVVVDVVEHHVRGVALGGELADLGGEQNHGNAGIEEDGNDNVGEAEHRGATEGGAGQVDEEDDQNDQELAAHEVAVEVVTLVAPDADLVREGVGLLVQVGVDGGKADEGALATLDHAEPEEGHPAHDEGDGGVGVLGQRGLAGEHQRHDNDDGEDQQARRIGVLEDVEGLLGEDGHGCGIFFRKH